MTLALTKASKSLVKELPKVNPNLGRLSGRSYSVLLGGRKMPSNEGNLLTNRSSKINSMQKRAYIPEYAFGSAAMAIGGYVWKDSDRRYYDNDRNPKLFAGIIFTAGLGTFIYALFDHDRTAKGKNNTP